MTSGSRPDFKLTGFVPYQVSMLAGSIRSGLLSVLDERFGLNIAEWRVFMAVGAFSPVTTKTVADHTTTAKAEISRAVTRLVEAGYLVRIIDPRDRRKVRLWFTDEGAQVYRQLQDFALQWEADMLSVLSVEEKALLSEVLRRLTEKLADAQGGRAQTARPRRRRARTGAAGRSRERAG